MSHGRLAAAVFALGAVLMLAFETTPTRIAGVLLLLVGIALGAFAIASEEFLSGDGRD
jgi:hypothetical protein